MANLAKGLAQNGRYLIEVIVLYRDGPVANDLKDSDVKIRYVNMRNIHDPAGFFRLMRILRVSRPSLVHTFLFDANFLGSLAAKLSGVKYVISSRRDTDIWKDKRHIWAERLGAKLSNKIVANSFAAKQFAASQENLPVSKFDVIYNGTDLKYFLYEDGRKFRKEYGISDDDLLVGTIGTLSEKKGQRFLVEAAAEVVKAFKQAKFVLVGCGPQEQYLKDLAGQLHLSEKIIFTGLRRDIPNILSGIDIFCLPSTYDSSPNAILEAMSIGLPVVSTDVGGISEIIVNNQNGILVKSKDHKARLLVYWEINP